MARTTVNIDENLLAAAQQALDTKGTSDTVNAALALAARRAQLARFDVRKFDITDEDIEAARRDRTTS